MTHSRLVPLPRQRSAAFAIMIVVVTLIVGTLLKLPGFQPHPAHAQTFNGLANTPTPPMGWDPWNFSHCNNQISSYNEQYYEKVADSFVSTAQGTSLRDAGPNHAIGSGYIYIMLGCGVNGAVDNNGNLVPASDTISNWPNGFSSIIQYIHSKGLKVEFYTVPETYCDKKQPHAKANYPAYGNEQALATAFARAGIDAVKYD